MMFLVLLIHFHGILGLFLRFSVPQQPSLWLHGFLIELQVDGVSRECEGLHNSNLHGGDLFLVTLRPNSRSNVVLISPWSLRWKKRAQH